MRIPLSRVYRAFPELDRFSDDQCSRFVRAACKRGWRRHLHRALLVILTPVAMIILWIVFGLSFSALTDSLGRSFEDSIPFIVLVVLGLVLIIFVPVLGAMLIRDRLLLSRIRFVLRARGTCPACRYSLLGIVVAQSNLVICPECGMEVEADPSLNELTNDEQGRARFTPTESIKIRRFWTPKRVRRCKWIAGGLVVLILVGLPAGWGGYELFLRRQAATALEVRPGATGISKFVVESLPPERFSGTGSVRAAIDAASIIRADVVFDTPRPVPPDGGRPIVPEYRFVYTPTDATDSPERVAEQEAQGAYALALLEGLRDQGFFTALDAIADRASEPPELLEASDEPVQPDLRPYWELMQFGAINAARTHQALQADDLEDFAAGIETQLAIARICYRGPSMHTERIGQGIETATLEIVRRTVAEHKPEPWLDAITAAIVRQRESLPPDYSIQLHRLYTLDALSVFFAEPDNARAGRFSSAIEAATARAPARYGNGDGALGTLAENRAVVNQIVDEMAALALLDPADRPTPGAAYPARRLLLIEAYLSLPQLQHALAGQDLCNAHRRATSTMLALERYYLAHQAYPETLTPLVPDYLPALPLDPWTGDPLIYRPTGPDNQTYLLYAVGPDATDSGGDPGGGRGREPDVVFSPAGD